MSDRLTDEDLARLEGLENAATLGEWLADSRVGIDAVYVAPKSECLLHVDVICSRSGDCNSGEWKKDPQAEKDHKLIAAARNALPKLLAEVRASRAEIVGLETLRATLLRHHGEWEATSGTPGHIAAMVIMNLARQRDALKADLAMASGTIHAQDERERRAGERCGITYEWHGCDWPDAMAEEVIRLRAERDALKARLEKEGA